MRGEGHITAAFMSSPQPGQASLFCSQLVALAGDLSSRLMGTVGYEMSYISAAAFIKIPHVTRNRGLGLSASVSLDSLRNQPCQPQDFEGGKSRVLLVWEQKISR